jgi:predicted transposase YdaD
LKYDTTLKSLFGGRAPLRLLEMLLGERVAVARMLPVELPETRNAHADLLIELMDGRLIHVELQAQPDAWFPFRMLEYRVRIFRIYGTIPLQIVLWLGVGPAAVASKIEQQGLSFSYSVVNAGMLDGNTLMESAVVEDCLFAILCRLEDSRAAVARILKRIAELSGVERRDALTKLLILSGLRGLTGLIEEEVEPMAILDVKDNTFLSKIYNQGLQEGIEQGIEKGIEQGVEQGIEQSTEEHLRNVRRILRTMVLRRFGSISAGVEGRIQSGSLSEIERWILRLMECSTAEEVLSGDGC